MRKPLYSVVALVLTILTSTLVLNSDLKPVSAKADVFHVTSVHAVNAGFDVDRCDGHPVSLTLYFNGNIHSTSTPSGNTQFHLTNTGRFEAVSLDPAFEDETGRFTVHVSDNQNSAGDNFVFNFRVKGKSTGGQLVQWNQTARVFIDADGELQVLFDRVVNCS